MKYSTVNHHTIKWPKRTHFRPARCEEVSCEQFLLGWVVAVPSISDHANFCRSLKFETFSNPAINIENHKYRFTEERGVDGLAVFKFDPFQPCFVALEEKMERDSNNRIHNKGGHWKRLERDPRFFIQRREKEPVQWIEEYAEERYQVGREFRNG